MPDIGHSADKSFVAHILLVPLFQKIINRKKMKTKQSLTAIVLLGTIIFSSCENVVDYSHCVEGKGEIIETDLSADSFSGLELKSSYNVVIRQGMRQEIKAVGHRNVIEDLELTVKNGSLNCGLEENCYLNYQLTLYVTVPTVSNLKVTGSGDIILEDFTGQGNLKTEITGSGDIFLNSSDGTQNLDAIITGSGDIVANKNIPGFERANVRISGSGSFRAYALQIKNCSVQIMGSGCSYSSVTGQLMATISGSGNVYYKGRPLVDANCSGSGKVVSAD